MATKVTLRQKAISNNRKSLYLDFYPPIQNYETGKHTRREFLKLYIFEKPKTPTDKTHNTETLKIADAIRQRRENEINKPEIYSLYEREQLRLNKLGEQCFIKYYITQMDKRKGTTFKNFKSTLNHLEAFSDGSIKFKDISENFTESFKSYLLNAKSLYGEPLSRGAASVYFAKFKTVLKQAFKDGFLQKDYNALATSIKKDEVKREYLTLDELNQLVKTQCKHPLTKQAAIFSALTGLRFSDIAKLTWNEVTFTKLDGYTLNFRQKKTKGLEVLPISEQAYNLTKGAKNPKDMPQNQKVFQGLRYSNAINGNIREWVKLAGISKNITFHCFRHTFATLQLSHGTDIYTVSKMLGHKDLKNTQVYAKIMDDAKRKAVNKIKLNIL